MRKTQFIALLIYVVSGMFLSFGMCMALIPEWNMVYLGSALGVIGILIAFMTFIRQRKISGKAPLRLSKKTLLIVLVAFVGTILFGCGMCLSLLYERFFLGISIGIVGILVLLCIIPLVIGFTD